MCHFLNLCHIGNTAPDMNIIFDWSKKGQTIKKTNINLSTSFPAKNGKDLISQICFSEISLIIECLGARSRWCCKQNMRALCSSQNFQGPQGPKVLVFDNNKASIMQQVLNITDNSQVRVECKISSVIDCQPMHKHQPTRNVN